MFLVYECNLIKNKQTNRQSEDYWKIPWGCRCLGDADTVGMPILWGCRYRGDSDAFGCRYRGYADIVWIPIPWRCRCLGMPIPWGCRWCGDTDTVTTVVSYMRTKRQDTESRLYLLIWKKNSKNKLI